MRMRSCSRTVAMRGARHRIHDRRRLRHPSGQPPPRRRHTLDRSRHVLALACVVHTSTYACMRERRRDSQCIASVEGGVALVKNARRSSSSSADASMCVCVCACVETSSGFLPSTHPHDTTRHDTLHSASFGFIRLLRRLRAHACMTCSDLS